MPRMTFSTQGTWLKGKRCGSRGTLACIHAVHIEANLAASECFVSAQQGQVAMSQGETNVIPQKSATKTSQKDYDTCDFKPCRNYFI
eukprot:3628960-Amphidinium_carterae.1